MCWCAVKKLLTHSLTLLSATAWLHMRGKSKNLHLKVKAFYLYSSVKTVTVWRNCNALVWINEVNLFRATSVLGWVIVMCIWSSWCYCHLIRPAGRPTCTVYADVTLTRSEVKVKVTDHLNFRQLPINVHFQIYLLRHFRVELKTDGWYWQSGTWSTASRRPIFEFPSRKAIT